MSFDNKSLRILDLFERFNKGEYLSIKQLVDDYGINEKTARRDIAELRNYLAEKYLDESDVSIEYDDTKKAYFFLRKDRLYLTCNEIMVIAKVILESRAFNKAELEDMLRKLILQASPNDRAVIKDMILNEQHHYIPLKHGTPLMKTIWEVSQHIKKQEIINFSYTRQDKKEIDRTIKPIDIIFSEFYFYLIGYIYGIDKDSPAVFRLDRCKNIERNIERTNDNFKINRHPPFELGEFRKRVQFMSPGELIKIKFKFWGSSLESILDKLPTAEELGKEGEKTIVKAEVYGKGVKMWLLSQMEYIEILEPLELRQEIMETLDNLYQLYKPQTSLNT